MDTEPTITLYCVRKDGRRERTKISDHTMADARELAEWFVRRQLFLWADDNYFSRSATTTTVSSVGQGRSPAAVRVCLKR
jgi:hypothetical protein